MYEKNIFVILFLYYAPQKNDLEKKTTFGGPIFLFFCDLLYPKDKTAQRDNLRTGVVPPRLQGK